MGQKKVKGPFYFLTISCCFIIGILERILHVILMIPSVVIALVGYIEFRIFNRNSNADDYINDIKKLIKIKEDTKDVKEN